MDSKKGIVLGIYISGFHITTSLVDLDKNEIIDETYYRTRVNSWASSDMIISAWCDAIKNTIKDIPLDSLKIGIAIPGQFDYENGISYIKGNKKYDSLYGLNIKTKLAQKLGVIPEHIRMLNDATAFLQGEILANGIDKSTNVIALTLGTGLGTAVYSNGVMRDAELWNSFFKDGRAENYISTRWLLSTYFESAGINIVSIKALHNLYKESATVKSVFRDFAANLGVLVKQFVEAEQPELIVLGGDITMSAKYFVPQLQKYLAQHNITTPIIISSLGNKSAIYGAACSWL